MRSHGGRYTDFGGGSIYWSPATGAHAQAGPLPNHLEFNVNYSFPEVLLPADPPGSSSSATATRNIKAVCTTRVRRPTTTVSRLSSWTPTTIPTQWGTLAISTGLLSLGRADVQSPVYSCPGLMCQTDDVSVRKFHAKEWEGRDSAALSCRRCKPGGRKGGRRRWCRSSPRFYDSDSIIIAIIPKIVIVLNRKP